MIDRIGGREESKVGTYICLLIALPFRYMTLIVGQTLLVVFSLHPVFGAFSTQAWLHSTYLARR